MNIVMWSKNTLLRHLFVAVVLELFMLTPAMAAVDSNETLAAIGRMPVLGSLNLPAGSIASTLPVSDHAKVGEPLTLTTMGINLSTLVTDADGDIESGSIYEWLIDDVVVSTALSFTPQVAHGGQLLSVRVTPKTQTGDPDAGNTVTSNAIVVRSALIDLFTKPDTTVRNWSTANTYCQNMGGGYSLATVDQLKQLYQEMTIATTTGNDYQLCERYGWPMKSKCGGSTNGYWASEPGTSGIHYLFDMHYGTASDRYDTYETHVVCVR